MAKKKKRKEAKKPEQNYQSELKGIILILLTIIGFGKFGPVGKFISAFASFLVGTWYNVLLLAVLIVGFYMIVKREKPKFLTSKLWGIYIIAIAFLVLSHLDYVIDTKLKGFEILEETVNTFMTTIESANVIQGGGIIGACFTLLSVSLFDIDGTKIVVPVLCICGIVMFTGVSIMDVLKKFKEKSRQAIYKSREKHAKEAIAKAEEHFEKDNKIVVSSMDELIHINDEHKNMEEMEKDSSKESKEPLKEEATEERKEEMTVQVVKPHYHFPSLSLLSKPLKGKSNENQIGVKENITILEQVLRDFGIEGKVVGVNIGPSVTQYELEIKAGTKMTKLLGLNREIALALAAKDVRIQAPIPGKRTVGIEIPNKVISMVTVREILEMIPENMRSSKLLVTLGKDIMGKPIFAEINKTPHLLVAGATGSGKSVCINSFIISILMRTKPEEVKLVLVDPKKVELSMYNGVPHLLAPVVTDPRKANIALKKIVVEMERRYDEFEKTGTKNIAGYNTYIENQNKLLPEDQQLRKLPFIVVIIDELADLMLVAAKEVEDSIMRITQMARAAGIHLIVATQRPSTDVITGVVKANIPSRISFAVSSQIDSRTILDMAGAEKLLGKGDMLFLPMGESTPIRVQGTFISEEEIKAVVDHVIKEQIAHYDETLLMDDEEMNSTSMVDGPESDANEEPLYNEIVKFVVEQQKASASLLQRRFRLGYNRAARVIDLLEERGIIGPNNGSKPREVLVKLENKE